MTSTDASTKLLTKAFHDIKNPLANLTLLTEISDFPPGNTTSPILRTLNAELWKVVARLDMLQLLMQSLPAKNETWQEIRIDDYIDEAIANIRNIDRNFHIEMRLDDDIEAAQLTMQASHIFLSRLFYFLIRQLYSFDSKNHWYINISHSTKGLEINFSKTNSTKNNNLEWISSFDANWEWLAAQKIAQQHDFLLEVAYQEQELISIILIH